MLCEVHVLSQGKCVTLRDDNDSWNQRLMLGPPAAATSSRAVVADELTTMTEDVADAALAVASSPSSWAARCSAFCFVSFVQVVSPCGNNVNVGVQAFRGGGAWCVVQWTIYVIQQYIYLTSW